MDFLKLKRVLVLLLVLFTTMLFPACGLLPKEEEVDAPGLVTPEKIEYSITEVKRGTISKESGDVGVVVSRRQQNVIFSSGKGGNLINVKVKPGDSVKKGDLIAEIDASNLNSQIREQDLILKKADLQLEKLKNTGGDIYALQGAELDIEIAKNRLEQLNNDLSRTKVYASISGRIVQMPDLKIGDFVEPFKTIAVIADPSNVQLELTGAIIQDYKVGMKAKVSYKEGEIKGTLVSVPNTANKEDKQKVIVSLDKIPKEVQVGDFLSVNVDIVKKENVLYLPKTAVKTYNKNYYVEYLKDGVKAVKYIQIGIETAGEYEILDGLQEGDKVISE